MYNVNHRNVLICIGNSRSKYKNEALSLFLLQEFKHFRKEHDGIKICALFSTSDIELLYKALDLTTRWSSRSIYVSGKTVTSTELRNSLWCFRRKVLEEGNDDYCFGSVYGMKGERLPCKGINFPELELGTWTGYGEICNDIWIFDLPKIKRKLIDNMEVLRYCPLLNRRKLFSAIECLPKFIDPKGNCEWAYVDKNNMRWIWHIKRWINIAGQINFPGYENIVGVARLDVNVIKKSITRFSDRKRFLCMMAYF